MATHYPTNLADADDIYETFAEVGHRGQPSDPVDEIDLWLKCENAIYRRLADWDTDAQDDDVDEHGTELIYYAMTAAINFRKALETLKKGE